VFINEHYGNFCQMVSYKDANGVAGLGPDYVRLKNRFEVTNGVGLADDQALEMRAMSYTMMLGEI